MSGSLICIAFELNIKILKYKMEVTTREWISFFQEARIPRTAAAQYAMTFVENRITMDMLLDLNKVSTICLSSAI